MIAFLIWIAVGTAIFFAFPRIARALPGLLNRFSGLIAGIGRIAGIMIIFAAIALTSFLWVPDGKLGTVFRIYGGSSLTEGKIIAISGENGPQGRIFTPGFHPELLVNVFNDVNMDTSEVQILDGTVGILTARDGVAFRAGQAFADPFPAKLGYKMLDAETFLKNGGQRGPQLSVLTPGKYRLNPYLWDLEVQSAHEIQAGFVGVVKSNVHADIDFGTLKAAKPESCELISPIKTSNTENDSLGRIDAPLVPVGCIGVWNDSLRPGKYYFNPDAFTITPVDTRAQVWTYAGGYTRASIALTVDAEGEIVQNRTEEPIHYDERRHADRAVFVKMEGWDVPLELRVVAQVSPDNAACVVAGVGGLQEVEDRVLTPSIRAITRDVAGGTYEIKEPKVDAKGNIVTIDGQTEIITVNRLTKVLDLINQRPLIEGEIERRIRPEGEKSCVTIREVRLGEPSIPPELLVAVKREQLATQLAKAFIQEKAAQEQRVASEKAKSTADQQGTLVTAEIGVQASEQNAIAARNEGNGERDKLKAIAEGQREQMTILGVDSTVQLRQYELLLGNLFTFMNEHPEVIEAALTNAQKFVPNISVGADGGGSNGMISALLGQSLQNKDSVGLGIVPNASSSNVPQQ